MILARIAWVFPATYLPRWVSAKLRARDPSPPVGAVFVISWAGMRGVVSLAAALALPIDVPDRSLLIYLTLCVILATLVGQGLTLPWVVRRLGVVSGLEPRGRGAGRPPGRDRRGPGAARAASPPSTPTTSPLVDNLRAELDHEARPRRRVRSTATSTRRPRNGSSTRRSGSRVVAAQRDAVIQLRDDGVIGDEALRIVERDLDLEAVRAGA